MKPYYQEAGVTIHHGSAQDVLAELPSESVYCVVTSPPYYGLRDYGCDGQLGLERTYVEYIDKMVQVFAEVRRVLRDDGTLWLNIGDSYVGGGGFSANAPTSASSKSGKYGSSGALKPGGIKPEGCLKAKDLMMMPARLAIALQEDGWYLRSDIIWHKANPMPESVTDRPTTAHEHIFLFAKSEKYYYDAEAIKEPSTGNAHDRARKERSAVGQKSMPTCERNGIRPAGVNPKAMGPNSRMKVDRDPAHVSAANIRIKQNRSFSAAVAGLVDFRNKRTVWTVATQAYSEAHFATFPGALIRPCIKAGCPVGGIVLDPFGGSGTTAAVSRRLGRECVLIELNEAYCELAARRLSQGVFDLQEVPA